MIETIEHIFRWDLDKTYLRTDINSWRGLLRAALEPAKAKKAYPGAPALLRMLSRKSSNRICLVSGSPRQMRKVLSTKLALDGIRYHELQLKNNLRNLLKLRFRSLRSQIPYKLPTLLASRCQSPIAPMETLVGDDAESDAIVYSLYAEILAGNVSTQQLQRVMEAARAFDDEMENTLTLAQQVPKRDAVQRILIHLDLRSPTATFRVFGKRLVPVYNYFQAAVILYSDALLTAEDVFHVAQDMLRDPNYHPSSLGNSLQDLLRRGRISIPTAEALAQQVAKLDPTHCQIAGTFSRSIEQLGQIKPPRRPNTTPPLDFVSLVDRDTL